MGERKTLILRLISTIAFREPKDRNIEYRMHFRYFLHKNVQCDAKTILDSIFLVSPIMGHPSTKVTSP